MSVLQVLNIVPAINGIAKLEGNVLPWIKLKISLQVNKENFASFSIDLRSKEHSTVSVAIVRVKNFWGLP